MSIIWKGDFAGLPGKVVLANPMVCTNTAKGDNKLYSDAKGVVPSLDLRFASQKNLNDYMTGTPLVDHQRSMSGSNLSPGTFVNSNGLIETAKNNLIIYSQEFENSSIWVSTNLLPFGSGSIVNSISAPNNTLTADKLVEDNSTGVHRIVLSGANTPSITIGVTYTVSIYAKAGERTKVRIQENATTAAYAEFDLTLGTKISEANGGSGSITPAGNGWYRCLMTFTAAGTTGRIDFFLLNQAGAFSYAGDGTSGIYVWGAQLEENSTATTYIPTTNVPSAAPRFDHNPTTGESLGLLVEEQRANLLLRSQEFDNSYWTLFPVGDTTIAPDAVTAPDGTLTADKLVEGTSTGRHYIEKLFYPGASTTYTFSVYVKAAGRTQVVIYPNAQTAFSKYVAFNLSSGVVIVENGSNITGNIQKLANEWFRVSITTDSGANGQYSPIIGLTNNTGPTYTDSAASYTGDGTSGIYIWGAQLEAGSFPTSYIPTTGTALTRSADVASITGSNFSSWYNQEKGTFLTNYTLTNIFTGYVLKTDDTTTSNVISFITNSNAVLINTSGAQQYLNSIAAPSLGTNVSVALSYETNNVNSAFNGSVGVVDTSASIPVVTQLRNTGNTIGPVSRLTYFPDRLPDATLQAITAP